jgi:pumilio RNA-binding family
MQHMLWLVQVLLRVGIILALHMETWREFRKHTLRHCLLKQKQQYELPHLGKSGGFNHGYYGNPSYGFGMPYPGNPMADSVLPSIGSESPLFQNDRISNFTSMMRNTVGGSIGPWHSDISSNMEGRFASTLLDEFKTNKTRSFELSDIVDYVVEFRYACNALISVFILLI